ncbi:MAG TPA: hypothetical protein VIE89_33555 [Candidatus Binatia bacterium]
MRAIASAKRLCSIVGARCTIVWDWGDYRTLFDDDTEWMPYQEPMDWRRDQIVPGYHHIRHLPMREGGSRRSWRVPVTTHPRVALTSWFVFCAAEERLLRRYTAYEEQDVFAWFPKPHPLILQTTADFKQTFFHSRTVGMHIRRTDNIGAMLRSPDQSYFKVADRLVESGYHIFLATDNQETLHLFYQRYGEKLIHYPKSSVLESRWPRNNSSTQEIIDDMMDLWLLASCEFVIGSQGSSYSRVAILLNGSPRCKLINHPLGTLRYGLYRMESIGRRLSGQLCTRLGNKAGNAPRDESK